jgi:hypothetical protein
LDPCHVKFEVDALKISMLGPADVVPTFATYSSCPYAELIESETDRTEAQTRRASVRHGRFVIVFE